MKLFEIFVASALGALLFIICRKIQDWLKNR